MNKEQKYTYISNLPIGDDLFDNKSHKKIAEKIADLIKNDEKCKTIGLDGEWGSGKSNIIECLRKNLQTTHSIFIFDIWSHQEDLQRRSLLESLTTHLIKEKLVSSKEEWNNQLKLLTSKTKETSTKNIPRLTWGTMLLSISFLLIPIVSTLEYFKWIPFLLFILLFLIAFIVSNRKKASFLETLYSFIAIYKDKEIEITSYERISEEEPTVKQFRDWMKDISNGLNKPKLVIVFDNMDRLPIAKIQEFWTLIHTFFAEEHLQNISVIVPFDRNHIIKAFCEENNENEVYCFGNDYINKTFNVVFRVSPPIISDWKKFFILKWKEAFANGYDEEETQRVIQIYSLIKEKITPREIIAFINEFVSILSIQNEIKYRYIAIFILRKSEILKNPLTQIISSEYLGPIEFIYKSDSDLQKNIAALTYQIPQESALQVAYLRPLQNALNSKDIKKLEELSKISGFDSILIESLTNIDNPENAIEAIEETSFPKAKTVWDTLNIKLNEIEDLKTKISKSHAIIASKENDPNEFLKKHILNVRESTSFSHVDYVSGLNILFACKDKFSEKLDWALILDPLEIEDPKTFYHCLEIAIDNISLFKIKTDALKLDEYLSNNIVTNFSENEEYLKIILKEYNNLPKTLTKLKDLRSPHASNLERIKILSELIKIANASNEKYEPTLTDEQIDKAFQLCSENDDFRYDLIAMRISIGKDFNSQYKSRFAGILEQTDENIVSKVTESIFNYSDYEDLLLNDKKRESNLHREIVNYSIRQDIKCRILNVQHALAKFKDIVDYFNIDVEMLLEDLAGWENAENVVNSENIKDIISIESFKLLKNSKHRLALNIKNAARCYLDSISKEDWYQYIEEENSYPLTLSVLINDYKYSLNAINAIDEILRDIVEEKIDYIPNQDKWDDILSKVDDNNKSHTFKGIASRLCDSSKITPKLFCFVGRYLFEYGELETNTKTAVNIFKKDIVTNPNCLSIMAKYLNNIKQILSNSNSGDKDVFINEIKTSAESKDENAIRIAEFLNIETENKDT